MPRVKYGSPEKTQVLNTKESKEAVKQVKESRKKESEKKEEEDDDE